MVLHDHERLGMAMDAIWRRLSIGSVGESRACGIFVGHPHFRKGAGRLNVAVACVAARDSNHVALVGVTNFSIVVRQTRGTYRQRAA